jgi:hypothetical protein
MYPPHKIDIYGYKESNRRLYNDSELIVPQAQPHEIQHEFNTSRPGRRRRFYIYTKLTDEALSPHEKIQDTQRNTNFKTNTTNR